VEAKYAQSDPQVAGFFAHHRSYLATLPDQQAEFPTVHASLDDFDKKQLKASNAQFTPAQTSGYGTVLAHQPQLSGGAHWGQGLSVQGKTTLDMAQIKAFDANALGHEMNSVNGPSGSTNIMSFLYLQMQKENPALNLQDAFAGTMMFLTFDGGHSLPESVGTFRAITSDTRPTQAGGKPAPERDQIMAQRRQVLETNVLAYGQLDQLFGSPQTATGVAAAVERAWDRTRQSFDEVHAQRTASTS
jgi:RTX toxin RtxA